MDKREIEELYLGLNEMSVEELEKAINDSFNIIDSNGESISVIDFIRNERLNTIRYYCKCDQMLTRSLHEIILGEYDYDVNYRKLMHCIFDLRNLFHERIEQLESDHNRLEHLPSSSLDYFQIKSIGNSSVYYNPHAPEFLLKLCIKELDKRKDEIKKIIHENPKKTKYVLEVINQIAPAIAQAYKGIPALAIVGSIILLFKQCIFNFLDRDLEETDNNDN